MLPPVTCRRTPNSRSIQKGYGPASEIKEANSQKSLWSSEKQVPYFALSLCSMLYVSRDMDCTHCINALHTDYTVQGAVPLEPVNHEAFNRRNYGRWLKKMATDGRTKGGLPHLRLLSPRMFACRLLVGAQATCKRRKFIKLSLESQWL